MSLLDALFLGDLRLPRPSPPPDGGHLPNVLQRLYLRLLTNAQFKEVFARAYARHYLPLATGFCAADQSQDDAIFSSQISVQFLNRPSLVAPLADQGMLRTMLVALAQVVASAEDEATGKLGAASVLLARRRYVPVLADLRFVLAIEGVAASFLLRKTTLLSEWMGFLRRIQAMDAQQRQRGERVLREHETWVNAFNFSIHLSSMYRLLLKPLAAQPHIAAGPHAAAGGRGRRGRRGCRRPTDMSSHPCGAVDGGASRRAAAAAAAAVTRVRSARGRSPASTFRDGARRRRGRWAQQQRWRQQRRQPGGAAAAAAAASPGRRSPPLPRRASGDSRSSGSSSPAAALFNRRRHEWWHSAGRRSSSDGSAFASR